MKKDITTMKTEVRDSLIHHLMHFYSLMNDSYGKDVAKKEMNEELIYVANEVGFSIEPISNIEEELTNLKATIDESITSLQAEGNDSTYEIQDLSQVSDAIFVLMDYLERYKED